MSIKVLVADDSITIQKVIGIIFGGEEYSLTVVDNGKAAVEKAREINPDILLIDAMMPGMTGYEVAEVVRSTPSLATKPILILTGSFEPFDEEKAKKCGADDFIAKPFESQQIISKVKDLLELGRSRAQTAQVSQLQPTSEILRDQTSEVLAPMFDIPTTVFDQHFVAQQPAAPADIWGAFTQEAEPPFDEATTPIVTASYAEDFEHDVFAIVTEENDAQLVKDAATADTQPHHTGSQWIPVEENTFEFEEEAIAEPPQTSFSDQKVSVQESSFGDISFEDDVATPAAPAFKAPPELESVSVAEIALPAATLSAINLTEEQLKTAIMAASKEVIERIVWEVVPDLADALIREAIRKIKEGV
jgi:CheY-like chemotaxis protein